MDSSAESNQDLNVEQLDSNQNSDITTTEVQEKEKLTSNHPCTSRKIWVMDPRGMSYEQILREFVQHALKKQLTYEFKVLQNAEMPISATILIDGTKYGIGYGFKKKQAKSAAAKLTLDMLIPHTGASTSQSSITDDDLSFLDDILEDLNEVELTE